MITPEARAEGEGIAGGRKRRAGGGIPSDLAQLNKRSVHRAFEAWGARAAIKAATEVSALATHTETARQFRDNALAIAKQAQQPPPA